VVSQGTSSDRCKPTAVEVVVTSSPLFKLTFFPTDCQASLLLTCAIIVIEQCA